MTLTERFFAIFGFIQVIGILATWRWEFLAVYLLLLTLLAYWSYSDLKNLAREGDFTIQVTPPKLPCLSQEIHFEVHIEPVHLRALAQNLVKIQSIQSSLFGFQKSFLNWCPSDSPEGARLNFRARVLQLGFIKIETWTVVATSKHKLLRRKIEIEIEPIELRVTPERAYMNEQAFTELIQTQRVLHQGARIQTRTRTQDQFHSLRKYQYPDPVRNIDQKKTARLGEPVTRTFDTHRSHHLVIALDIGRSLNGMIRGSRKIDYYLSAALALAENAIKSRDEVSFFAFSQTSHMSIRRTRSLRSFNGLFRSEVAFQPRDEESNYAVIPNLLRTLAGSRSIVVILTDLSKPSVQEGLLESLSSVCQKHLTVAIGLNDRDVDLEERVLQFPVQTRDQNQFLNSYSDLLYSYWVREKHLLFRERFARYGGGSLAVNDAHWMTTIDRLYELLRSSRLA